MPSADTKYFGSLNYREEAVLEFPQGLPAFEEETRFVLIEMPEHEPLVFLQSLRQPGLCFLTFPILVVDRDYELEISAEDLARLELDSGAGLELGSDLLVLALISLHDGLSATANLMAPIVVNLRKRRGLQSIRQDRLYSHQHPVVPQDPEAAC